MSVGIKSSFRLQYSRNWQALDIESVTSQCRFGFNLELMHNAHATYSKVTVASAGLESTIMSFIYK